MACYATIVRAEAKPGGVEAVYAVRDTEQKAPPRTGKIWVKYTEGETEPQFGDRLDREVQAAMMELYRAMGGK